MTYSSGGLIQATYYNGFVNNNSGANINATWGQTATSTSGYGQVTIGSVSAGDTVSATQWATLVNTITSAANHQGTSITARSAPTAGSTITALAAVNTDLTSLYNNRNNAYAVGSQVANWTGTTSQTSGEGGGAWTQTYTHTVTFANLTSLYSFFNCGGYIKIQFSKTSTGAFADSEWNSFIGNGSGNGAVSILYHTGAAGSKTIAGTTFTGFYRTNGSGSPSIYASSTGVYALSGSPTTLYTQYDTGYPAYTSNYVNVTASISGAVITYTTTWHAQDSKVGANNAISGGSGASGATFGTAPTTLLTYYPPETTYLSNTWGTPTVAATVSG
jgi:hypothetical protein